jgi:hypothetical protein
MELQELEKYQKSGYRFDYVVLVYCLNDVADLFPEWKQALEAIQADSKSGSWLRRHSFFLDILHHRRVAAENPYVKNYYDFIKKGYQGALWELQRQRLSSLRQLVESNGGRFMVVTIPFMQSMGANYEYQSVHEELGKFWKQQNVPYLDLLSTFAGHERITVNTYDPHPNEFANSLVAKAIEPFLAQEVGTNRAAAANP